MSLYLQPKLNMNTKRKQPGLEHERKRDLTTLYLVSLTFLK
jgi:hypothetical protein